MSGMNHLVDMTLYYCQNTRAQTEKKRSLSTGSSITHAYRCNTVCPTKLFFVFNNFVLFDICILIWYSNTVLHTVLYLYVWWDYESHVILFDTDLVFSLFYSKDNDKLSSTGYSTWNFFTKCIGPNIDWFSESNLFDRKSMWVTV